jgi:hypothetical protein
MAGFSRFYRPFNYPQDCPALSLPNRTSFHSSILNALFNLPATKFVTWVVTFSVELPSFLNHFSQSLESEVKRKKLFLTS